MYLGVSGEMLWQRFVAITIDCGVDADWAKRRPSTFVSTPNSCAGTPYWLSFSRLVESLCRSEP